MRTTITLEPDVEAALRTAMQERGAGLKEAVNDALRRGLGLTGSAEKGRYRMRPQSMGVPAVPLEHALRLAAAMEDEAIVRKMTEGR